MGKPPCYTIHTSAYFSLQYNSAAMIRLRNRCSTWIAIFAMALNAVWPLLAQARPGPAPTLHEVCTASGLQIISVAAEVPGEPASAAKASPHCAFCSLGTDQLAVLPAPQSGTARFALARDPFPDCRAIPVPESGPSSPALPRAPPFLS